MPLGPDVDLTRIAATTPGMVGADLANLVNEAALLAARRDHDSVAEADFTDALERIKHCFGQLTDEQVWGRSRPDMNSVANLLLHLTGNVRQWIVGGLGGAADWK